MGLISIIYAALGVSVLFILLDQLAKWAVAANLAGSAPVTVIPGIFQLTYVENTGAAFSSFDGQRWFLIVVTGLVIIGLLYLLLSVSYTHLDVYKRQATACISNGFC